MAKCRWICLHRWQPCSSAVALADSGERRRLLAYDRWLDEFVAKLASD